MNKINVNIDFLKELRDTAEKNGKLWQWTEIAFDWMNEANAELIRLKSKKECQHIIVDCRNKVITSGYMCTECNAVFAAGDH